MLELLKKYKLEPKHFRGQNFLVDKSVLSKIVETADLKVTDNVLEIGPGLGVLTKELVGQAGKVLAVELDKELVYVLEQENRKERIEKRTKKENKLTVWSDNILDVRNDKIKEFFKGEDYKIIANIPYYITAKILRKFLETDYQPTKIVLLVQKEVAQRIVAKPGKMSLLSVSVQYFSEPKIVQIVPQNSFYPAPKVESAIIELFLRGGKGVKGGGGDQGKDVKNFFRIVKIGFSAKRKQLQNNLANGLDCSRDEIKEKLAKIGLKENIRAQELSLQDWQNLIDIL